MLARNEKQIRDEILDYIEKERQKLEGVNNVQKSLNKETATGANPTKKPTELQLASFNAENWANEEAKGLHNALRKKIESGEKIKIVPIEVDLDKIDIAVDKDKLPDFSSQIDKNKQYAESLGYIGDAFSSIGSIVDDSNAAVIQYFANLINSMASAIPMIASMVTAKRQRLTQTPKPQLQAQLLLYHPFHLWDLPWL